MQTVAEPTQVPEARWRTEARAVAVHLGSCLWAGLVGGLVVGGIGSRIAMLVLRLTSDPAVVGLESDDGFTIGQVGPDTFFLVMFGAALGTLVGLLYAVVRSWIPPRLRVGAFCVLGALVGGSEILHADGIDFRVLEPTWLAVVMFVALPAAGGAAIAFLAERLLQRAGVANRALPLVMLPLLGTLILGPLGLALIVTVPLGVLLNRRVPLVGMWTAAPMAWLGRVVLVAWGLAAAVALGNDLIGIF